MTTRKTALGGALCLAVAAALLVPAGAAWPGQGEESKPIDPKPPVLKQVRWQYLHKRYQDVYIDGSGRAWFLIRTFPTFEGKWPSRFLTCPELPEDYIEIPGKNRIIGFDRQDRLWEVGEHGLLCSDVRTGKFTQRRPTPGVTKERLSKGKPPAFGAVMLEHSSGRLYFLDTLGVHMLENGKWRYHEFSPGPSSWETWRSGPHWPMKMAEGPRGRVFLWGVLRGVWVHDKATWKHYSIAKYPQLARTKNIVPLEDGSIEVYCRGGSRVTLRLGSGATSAPARKKTSRAKPPRRQVPIRNDKSYPARVLGEELSMYDRALGKDRRGRVYFSARDQEIGGGRYVRIAVFDPRYKETAPTLKYQCFRIQQVADKRALAVDSQGRIWARLRVKEHPFLSRYEKGKWTHFPDPAPSAPLPGRKLILWDDRTWLMKPVPKTPASWRLDREKDFVGLPGMANPALLQSLRNGCMLASEEFDQRAFLFDGKTWHAYKSLRVLVEERYSWLLKHVDNEAGFWRRGPRRIGRDATGRLWLTERWNRRHFRGAYDGKQWHDIPKGNHIFNKAAHEGIAVGKAGGKVPEPYRHPYKMHSRIVEQGKGVFWAAASNGLFRLRVVKKGGKMHFVPDRHYPRIIPQGPIEWIALGRDGALWMSTLYGESGLYRIEIPPLDKQKD